MQSLDERTSGNARLGEVVKLALGQGLTGTISGTVSDPSGSAIPSAEIVLTNVAPGRLVLRVSAAMRGSRIYRPVAFRITVPVHGAVRVARL